MGRPKESKRNGGLLVSCPLCESGSYITNTFHESPAFTKFHAECKNCGKGYSGHVEITHWLLTEEEIEAGIDTPGLALGIIKKKPRRKTEQADPHKTP